MFRIVIDTREQAEYSFACETVRRKLEAGDYSVDGYENVVAVDRHAAAYGRCGLGAEGRVYKEFLHFGEEPEVVPTHAIYLAGCNFRCTACSDLREVLSPRATAPADPAWLAARIRRRRAQGARTVTFVGGSPDVQPLFILRTLALAPADTRVVWNSNLWLEPETLDTLLGVVWLFIPDLKFGPGTCDRALSGTPRTFPRILGLLEQLRAAKASVLLRHLLVPGHARCCSFPILEALSDLWPGLRVNLMTAYRPFALAGTPGPTGRPLRRAERRATLAEARARFAGKLSLRVDGLPCP